MLPNFIIIGALKAGTSSLYNYLNQHPDVFMPSLKELRFFAFNEECSAHVKDAPRSWPITNLEGYMNCFKGVKMEKAIGEASPNYLHSSIAAVRINATIPSVKLIASLRNPAERLYSAYLMKYRSGEETRSFRRFFQEDSRDNRWMAWNSYYENLRRYYDIFDREHIKIVVFEELKRDSLGVVKRLYNFIGVDDRFTPDTAVAYNRGGIPRSKILHLLLEPSRNTRLHFSSYLPDWLRSIYRYIKALNLDQSKAMLEECYEEVIRFYLEDIKKTEDLIQKDLSSWYRSDLGVA
jgi:hypothetical protein